MDLMLWRHAEAEDGHPDEARALSDKGHRQAGLVAKWLKGRLPRELRVLASPTVRTRQTVEPLGLEYETCSEIAPGARAADLLRAADWPTGHRDVLIVGHQPTLGRTAALLLSGSEQEWSIRKGALWWFQGRARGETVLVAVITPSLLAVRSRH